MTEQERTIKGCLNNNRVSQEKLYMQLYPVLLPLCRRFFDDEHEIITAINNGMLKVFKNIGSFDAAKSAIVTWVFTIVRNEALTMVKNKKSLTGTIELTEDLSADMTSNPFEQTEDGDVIYYLGKLSPTTRAVCTLFYLENYAIKEIAESLDIKEGTVKWHLSEGRKKIQSNYSNNTNRISNTG